jgi:2-methylisocitrate lyase-like PEP mutase family enzyme
MQPGSAAAAARLKDLHATTRPLVLPTVWDAWSARRPTIASVAVPVSVDLESGYGHPPADLVAGLIDVGAAGLNIEDTVHREGRRVRTAGEHAAYVAGLREAADAASVPLVINGRTDLFMHAEDKHAVLDEVIARLQGLVEAGADTVYPVRVQSDDDLVEAVCRAMRVPVNVTAHPVADSLAHLTALGVGRITFGPRLQAALTDYSREIESRWLPPGG